MPNTISPNERRKPIANPQGDAALEQRARASLEASGYRDVSQLSCNALDGIVILSGILPSFYLRQVAHAAIRKLEPSCRLEDRIHVSSLHDH